MPTRAGAHFIFDLANRLRHPYCPGLLVRLSSDSASGQSRHDRTASSQLWADAVREEAEAAAQQKGRTPILINEHDNWTGEESTRDAVLRMLVDKYKPLRSGLIQTAEEKLRQNPPALRSSPSVPPLPINNSVAEEPILPSVEGHKPWHTTFKAPSHATASIRVGRFSPSPLRQSAAVVDDAVKKKERESQKRIMEVGRLTRARESSMDYRMGIKSLSRQGSRSNPLNIKGWTSLVEERIERARSEGRFNDVKGRGKPIARHSDEVNPFIAREEFLMNRIVQRNGAAPPWVEIQAELESAVISFRGVLRQSWTRRAVRLLTISQPAALLHTITIADVTSLRDVEWEARERTYHDTALGEVNAIVLRYNGVAPYPVRKPYFTLSTELERMYRESVDDIMRAINARVEEHATGFRRLRLEEGEDNVRRNGMGDNWGLSGWSWEGLGIFDLIRGWVRKLKF